MRIHQGRGTAVAAVFLAAFLVSCSASPEAGSERKPTASEQPANVADAAAAAEPAAAEPEAQEPLPTPVEKVRDAFATLQATLGDTCTPGNCDYFLGRVNDELTGLDKAMKADPKGPGHFKQPLAWMSALQETLGDDTSTANLEKHRSELIGVRDKINTWMQDHPDDYR
ncbi:hypothetical protein HRW18_22525 [Streptomyces lunaelactis]|uniref:hypothetical protein n=1 Tax=Streptomyces lunaelactis TaxID=1535768 RepID=UPI001585541D|nr:hypothetical protein [Streptomyces lunaelactis]NUK10707.1 hypothetical protein [Streptomyces lunaelactis]NUL12679.1 hypothetical protein [Streptomyces lunaelactis]NUL26428.1 hypothetical protein [Streptomyces lunaelactis]